MPSATLANTRGNDRLWRRRMTSADERARTTPSVTTMALSSTGTYQVSAKVEGSLEKASQADAERNKIRTVLGSQTMQVAELK